MSDTNTPSVGSPAQGLSQRGSPVPSDSEEIEALRRQLKASNLQLNAAQQETQQMRQRAGDIARDRDVRLTEMMRSVQAAQQREGLAAQELDVSRHKEQEVIEYMQTLERALCTVTTVGLDATVFKPVSQQQGGSPVTLPATTAFQPVSQNVAHQSIPPAVSPTQAAVLGVIDQWNQRPGPQNAAQRYGYGGHQHQQMPQFQAGSAGGSVGYNPPTSFIRRGNDIPLPRQMTYDGSTTWQSFVLPFQSMATSCRWGEQESLFRLCNCLRGDAAEFVFFPAYS